MAKFKVGDRVRRINCSNAWSDGTRLRVGEIVTVVKINSADDISVDINGNIKSGNDPANFELVKEEPKPREFKVGDRVKAIKSTWGYKVDYIGTVISAKPDNFGVEFDKPCGGHDCDGKGKNGHCWWTKPEDFELIEAAPKEEPTPTPVVNVNVTVNLYENACWYCRKGGLVDLYLAGAMGICPSCGRVCNNTTPTLKKESIVIEFKPSKPKENKPLTTEELKALPNGAKVFLVFNKYEDDEYIDEPDWLTPMTCWRTKKGDQLVRDGGFSWIDENDDGCFKCYLEEPENERPF